MTGRDAILLARRIEARKQELADLELGRAHIETRMREICEDIGKMQAQVEQYEKIMSFGKAWIFDQSKMIFLP